MIIHRTSRFGLNLGLVVLTAAAFMLGSCTPSTTVQPENPPSLLTEEPSLTPLPTEAPTSTPQPTIAPTDTAIPESTLSPEEPAVSVDQVAGRWTMKLMGGGEGDPALLTLAPDSTWSIDGIGGYHEGMNLGFGTYGFEGDLFLLESDYCLIDYGPTDNFVPCTATYRVSVSMRDGKPALLRFKAIDDPFGDRKLSLNGKKLDFYTEQ